MIGVGDAQVEIEGLRMAFEVTKNMRAGSLPNSCVLEIYNLAPATRSRIHEEGTALQLFAGYEGGVDVLYSGELRRVVHERDGTDWVSKVYCSDRLTTMQESTISRTFVAGTPALTIINAVIESFGINAGDARLEGLSGLPALLRSRTLSGGTAEILEQLSLDFGFDWSWQDGRLELSGTDAYFDDEAVVISPDSGMIGQPVVTDQGVEVTTLLNPRIRVKRKIRIQSRAAALKIAGLEVRPTAPSLLEGDYVVNQVVFVGDTWGNDWMSRASTVPRVEP